MNAWPWKHRTPTFEEIIKTVAGGKGKLAYDSGDPEISPIACGQVVGAIDEIKTAREVIEGIITEARELLSRLNQMKEAYIMENVYERLRERLDDMAVGFPATESGVEMRILKKIFTESEAELFVKLRPIPESPKDIAERLGLEGRAGRPAGGDGQKGTSFPGQKRRECPLCRRALRGWHF